MIYVFLGINVLTFILYGVDKYLAKKNMYRISEYTLFVLSFFGGGIGAILGMKVFHHKTKKISFWILNILFSVLWIVFLFF